MKSLFYAFLFISFITACSDSDDGAVAGPKITNSKPGNGEVYVVGDSLGYGQGATDPNISSPAGCLGAEFTDAQVSNFSIPGFKTDELVANILYYLPAAPKMVFISTGGNDVFAEFATPGSYPAEKSVRELKKIILQFQAVGAMVAYLALNPPSVPPYGSAPAERLQAMAQVARENGAIIVDGMNGLWTDSTKMSDMIHPNDAGYQIMCDRIIQAVSPHYP